MSGHITIRIAPAPLSLNLLLDQGKSIAEAGAAVVEMMPDCEMRPVINTGVSHEDVREASINGLIPLTVVNSHGEALIQTDRPLDQYIRRSPWFIKDESTLRRAQHRSIKPAA